MTEELLPKVTGLENGSILLRRTGLRSFDWMMGYRHRPGVMLPTWTEFYGKEGVGKSTFLYYLSAALSEDGKGTIHIADLETSADPQHVVMNAARAGFRQGTINFLPLADKKGKPRNQSEILMELADCVLKEDTVSAVLDSVGMYIPPMEASLDDAADAVWGRRAQEIGKFARRMSYNLSGTRVFAAAVNHTLAMMSSAYGHTTPGGRVKNFSFDTRVWMRKKETVLESCQLVKMNTEKKRFGGNVKDRYGYVFLIPDYGVSPEMTAVFECFEFGLAQRTSGYVKVRDYTTKRLRTLIELAVSGEDPEVFLPFTQALDEYEQENFEV